MCLIILFTIYVQSICSECISSEMIFWALSHCGCYVINTSVILCSTCHILSNVVIIITELVLNKIVISMKLTTLCFVFFSLAVKLCLHVALASASKLYHCANGKCWKWVQTHSLHVCFHHHWLNTKSNANVDADTHAHATCKQNLNKP